LASHLGEGEVDALTKAFEQRCEFDRKVRYRRADDRCQLIYDAPSYKPR
jgi:hypothetical protein